MADFAGDLLTKGRSSRRTLLVGCVNDQGGMSQSIETHLRCFGGRAMLGPKASEVVEILVASACNKVSRGVHL